jgi:6-phospho-beta-glucosidase
MKIAIVGGSAASTPALFLTSEIRSLSRILDVTLIGRSQAHLRAVQRAIRILTDASISVECTTDLAGTEGASIVLLQARYGGYECRARDEQFPLKHDMCGDEGLGPGGLAAAWRSWPHISSALENVVKRCPRAKVLLMTAPLSLLVRCARTAFPALDVVGICELPWVTLRSVCASLNVKIGDVEFSYAGVNHLGWFDELRVGAVDLIPHYALTRRDGAFPSAELLYSCNAVPLKYLGLHYERANTLTRQRAQPPRAMVLQSIQQRAMRCFSYAQRDGIIEALRLRATPWYKDAVAPFVAAMAGRPTSTVFFLSASNNDYLPFLARDDTLEQPFTIEAGVRRRLPRYCDFPQPLSRTLKHLVDYERVAAEAVLGNRLTECANVLSKHPWVSNCRDIDALAADLIAAI